MFFSFFSGFHIKSLLIGALFTPYIYAQSSPDAQTFQSDAAQGNAKAQYNLGLCYYEGKGVSRSDSEAVQGDAQAQVITILKVIAE